MYPRSISVGVRLKNVGHLFHRESGNKLSKISVSLANVVNTDLSAQSREGVSF